METNMGLSRDEVWLKKLTDAVKGNLENEQFGVSELSAAVAISRFQLHRKLKSLKGKSVSQFIREVRLEEAMKMLRADVASVSEIGYRVGFGSPSYFNKCFHDRYGFSPGEARKRSIELNQVSSPEGVQTKERETAAPGVFRRKADSHWGRILRRAMIIAGSFSLIAVLSLYFMARPTLPQPSIAILPLENLSGLSEQTYFVNGMHDALIGELGQVSALRVISRTSTMRYSQSKMLLQDIARELGVNAIVEGSVYGSGDSLRIQLQLIQVFPEERHLWAKEYHEDIRKALAVHSNFVRDIAKEIQVSLTPEEKTRLDNFRITNAEAYKTYLRGMYHINQSTPEEVEKGIAYLQEAVNTDPADPLPWAGLAVAYSSLGHRSSGIPDAFIRAKAAAKRALDLDESLAEVHLALAMIALYKDWDWTAAENGFSRALAINPNLAEAHTHYAWFKMLFGKTEEVLIHGKKATDLDPFSSIYSAYLGSEYWYMGSLDLALKELEKNLKLPTKNALALFVQGAVYSSKGMHAEAITVHEQAANLSAQWKWALGRTYAVANKQADALRIADEVTVNPRPMDTWGLAEIYCAVGDKDQAFHWLEECYKVRFSWMPWIAWNPHYQGLKGDPRFDDLLKRLNLPAIQQTISRR